MVTVVTSHHRRTNPKVVARILGIFGALFLVGCIAWGALSWQHVHTWTKTTGTVTALTRQRNGYQPTVMFIDAQNTIHSFRSFSSQSPAIAPVGGTVSVYYNPQDPSHAVLNSFVSLWLGPLLFGIAAVVELTIALIFFLKSRKTTTAL